MTPSSPLTRELVLVGGGHSHALVLRMWGMKPLPGVRLTVVNPHPTAPYTGMLPGHVAGHYDRDALDIDLVRLARFANARLILDYADGMDPEARTIRLRGGRVLPYHVASVDIGITSAMPQVPGFAEHGVAAKPLDVFANSWDHFRKTRASRKAGTKTSANVAVIGGGIGGVELALAMDHALRRDSRAPHRVTIVEQARILAAQSPGFAKRMRALLAAREIGVIENATVRAVTPEGVALAGQDRPLAADFVVGAAGAHPHDWLAGTGLNVVNGFVAVDAELRSTSHPDVFAVGDCAHFTPAPRPKAGVFAVRQAPVLLHNLQAVLAGESLRRFRPQKDYLKLVSLGGKQAIADKWGLRIQGAAMWAWKDRIDQKFMEQFRALKPMPAPPLPARRALGLSPEMAQKHLCGGCGAKVGGGALGDVLARLPAPRRADVLSAPGDDGALLKGPGGKTQILSTDHLRAFCEDPGLMARIAAVHALGDVWAMGGVPQSALSTLILPRMSAELQRFWLTDIMAEAEKVFAVQGAAIVGGHTSLGAELTIGFAVTGLCDAAPITLGGARAGDVIILTKALGTGTILAAEMALQARGDWVAGALAQMASPQGDAAALLRGAHAMTDVTGFGLAGHLAGMARASGVEIRLDPARVPLLAGARTLAAQGVRSSLHGDNRALVPWIDALGDPTVELLFDPQTAGGLAAAVPAALGEEIVQKIKALGHEAAVIGTCHAGAPAVRLA